MKLNRTQLIISGVLLTVALILALYFSHTPGSLKPAEGGVGSGIRELVSQPVDLKPAVEKVAGSLPAGCAEIWERLTKVKLEDFQKFTEADRNTLQACSEALPILSKYDPSYLQRLRDACTTPDEEGSHAMQSNCVLHHLLYKAALVAWFNKDRPIKDLHSEELALILVHEYNNPNPGRMENLAQLADLLTQRTGSYSALKARASIMLLEFMKNPASVRTGDLRRIMTELSERNPHDEKLLELHFVALALMNDLKQMNELTGTYVRSHPSSAAGYYMRSAYFWQIKDRSLCIEALKNALALEPGSPRYQETLRRVETAEPAAPGIYDVQVDYDLLSE